MEKIMLVLENDTDLMFLERVLKRLKFDVISLKKGENFSEQLIDHFPDVVFASILGRNQKILSALGRIREARGKPKLIYVRQEKDSGSLSPEQREIIDGVLYSPIDPFKLIDLLAATTSEDIIELRNRYNKTLQSRKEKSENSNKDKNNGERSFGGLGFANKADGATKKTQFGEAIVYGSASKEGASIGEKGHEIVKGKIKKTEINHIKSSENLIDKNEDLEPGQSKIQGTGGRNLDSKSESDHNKSSFAEGDEPHFTNKRRSHLKGPVDLNARSNEENLALDHKAKEKKSTLIDDPSRKKKYDKICNDLNKKAEPKEQLDINKLRQLQREQAKEVQEKPSVRENRKHFLKTIFSMDPVKPK